MCEWSEEFSLPIIAAALMADSPSRLLDIPVLRDVQNLCEIIRRMGCKVEENGNQIIIDPSGIEKPEADHDLARKPQEVPITY